MKLPPFYHRHGRNKTSRKNILRSLKVNLGNERRFFGIRAGIFHPFDGFGASDRMLTAFFATSGFDQLGIEVDPDYGQTSVRAALLNGLGLDETNGSFTSFAAQGPLTKSWPLSRAHNSPCYRSKSSPLNRPIRQLGNRNNQLQSLCRGRANMLQGSNSQLLDMGSHTEQRGIFGIRKMPRS